MQLDPEQLAVADRYKLLIGGVVPRPIAVVSSLSPKGEPNLAPFSFFNAVSSDPMSLMFCTAKHSGGREKDTLLNVLPRDEGGTGEFVVHVAQLGWVRKMAATAEPLGYGQSEWDLSGLTSAASTRVAPPRIAESPLAFECETTHIIRLKPESDITGAIVIGRVVYIHAADGLVNERMHVDPAVLDAVGRMGGIGYCTTRDRFDLAPGATALAADDPRP